MCEVEVGELKGTQVFITLHCKGRWSVCSIRMCLSGGMHTI